jgi:Rrf2 family protein
MQISTKGRYAVRAMIDLALHGKEEAVPISGISKRQEISFQYVEQLLNKLKRAGIVESVRGPKGGYKLKKSPKKITIGDIIRVVEGPIDPVFCVNPEKLKQRGCARAELCASRLLWAKLGEKIAEVLDGTTLEDLCKLTKEFERKQRRSFVEERRG